MRSLFKILCLVVLGMAPITTSAARPAKQDVQKDTVTLQRIEQRDFAIRVMRAMPSGMGMVTLSTPYSLKVDGNTVTSYLPYFGRAYSLPYGGDQGLVFTGEIRDYEVKQGKKTVDISFNVKTDVDWFDFRIAVYPGGDCYLNVYPNYRQPIGYSGTLGPLE